MVGLVLQPSLARIGREDLSSISSGCLVSLFDGHIMPVEYFLNRGLNDAQ